MIARVLKGFSASSCVCTFGSIKISVEEIMSELLIVQDYVFFADEAGITQDRFTVVGGLCLSKAGAEIVYQNMKHFRNEYSMTAELKWSKISDQKQREYLNLVELFFALNNTNRAQFHCLIFDNHTWNHKVFNNNDSDIGLSKLYYQLLLHQFVKRCGKRGSLFACLDRRTSSTPLGELRDMINNAAENKFGLNDRPLKQLISKDSKEDDILQLNDVILGAVCAARNGRHLTSDGRRSKRVIAQKVLEKSGLIEFSQNSPPNVNRFTVWNFKSNK